MRTRLVFRNDPGQMNEEIMLFSERFQTIEEAEAYYADEERFLRAEPANTEELVREDWACPECGERRMDWLPWNIIDGVRTEEVQCATCGHIYRPDELPGRAGEDYRTARDHLAIHGPEAPLPALKPSPDDQTREAP